MTSKVGGQILYKLYIRLLFCFRCRWGIKLKYLYIFFPASVIILLNTGALTWSACNAGGPAFESSAGKIPCRRNKLPTPVFLGFPAGSDGEESAWNVIDLGSIPGLGRLPWRKIWLPTPMFWPGEFHGQRSLASCSLRDDKESNMTEWL